jgi:hypothetical protein
LRGWPDLVTAWIWKKDEGSEEKLKREEGDRGGEGREGRRARRERRKKGEEGEEEEGREGRRARRETGRERREKERREKGGGRETNVNGNVHRLYDMHWRDFGSNGFLDLYQIW